MESYLALRKVAKGILAGSVFLLALSFVSPSMAAINAQVGSTLITDVTNFEDFEPYVNAPGTPYVAPSGFTFDCGSCSLIFAGGWGTSGLSLYQNGGSTSMTTIKLTSGANFNAVSVVNGNGWTQDPDNVWVRAYNNGAPVASFEFPGIPLASTITVWADAGSEFDEVRIQSYQNISPIQANESQYGGIAIDDVTAGIVPAAVPVPTIGLPGLAVLVFLLAILGLVILRRRGLLVS